MGISLYIIQIQFYFFLYLIFEKISIVKMIADPANTPFSLPLEVEVPESSFLPPIVPALKTSTAPGEIIAIPQIACCDNASAGTERTACSSAQDSCSAASSRSSTTTNNTSNKSSSKATSSGTNNSTVGGVGTNTDSSAPLTGYDALQQQLEHTAAEVEVVLLKQERDVAVARAERAEALAKSALQQAIKVLKQKHHVVGGNGNGGGGNGNGNGGGCITGNNNGNGGGGGGSGGNTSLQNASVGLAGCLRMDNIS